MGKRILIVDDDPMIRMLEQEILSAEGHDIVVATSGEEAIAILEKEPKPINFQLIVLDVVMPGMNGLDVLVRLKLHSSTAKIPVVMLTGEKKAEDLLAGYSVGADYYITKPFTRQQLLHGVALVLEGGESA